MRLTACKTPSDAEKKACEIEDKAIENNRNETQREKSLQKWIEQHNTA